MTPLAKCREEEKKKRGVSSRAWRIQLVGREESPCIFGLVCRDARTRTLESFQSSCRVRVTWNAAIVYHDL